MGFSKKSGSVTHNYIWDPNTMLNFRKKTNEPIPRKLTDRRKNKRKDGLTLFYRTFLVEAGGPIGSCNINILFKKVVPDDNVKDNCRFA